MSLLKVEGLVKRYGNRTVVNDVGFHVDEGEIVEQNTPHEFFENPQSDRTKLFLSQILAH